MVFKRIYSSAFKGHGEVPMGKIITHNYQGNRQTTRMSLHETFHFPAGYVSTFILRTKEVAFRNDASRYSLVSVSPSAT